MSRRILVSLLALACADVEATTSPQQEIAVARPEKNTAIRSEKITGGGGLNLTIYDAGSAGAPAIVFIHGFSQNFMTWDAQFRGLADRYHVTAYDFRGHGASEKPLDPAKYTDSNLWADDLAALIRARNLRRPVLVGWSYGGFVIADYLRKYGDANLGGLVFVGAITKNGTQEAAGHLTPEVLAIFGDVLSNDVRTGMTATRKLTRMFAGHDAQQWEVAFGSAMMVAPEIRQAMFSRILDNDDVLARVRVPTLVVQGANDALVQMASAQHIAKTIPGAKLLVYDKAGHAPHLEAPARFNRDIAEFVKQGR